MQQPMRRTGTLPAGDAGASAVEYGVLLGLIIAILMGTIATVGQDVLTMLESFVASWT